MPRPGGDDADVAGAEEALAEARADLEGFLADTSLRSILGPDRYNEAAANFVAVVNKCEADLAAARETSSASFELVGPSGTPSGAGPSGRNGLSGSSASSSCRGAASR